MTFMSVAMLVWIIRSYPSLIHSFTPSPLHSFTLHAFTGLLCHPSAVDRQRRAGNRGGGIAAEKHRKRGHFLDLDELLARLALEDDVPDDVLARDAVHLRLVIDLLLHQRSQHVPRADRVAGDALARGLERHGLGESDQTVLGGDIRRFERGSNQSVSGGHVDDAAPALAFHSGKRGADGMKRR